MVEPRSVRLVRRAGVGDLDACASALGDAFADYPWTRWTVDARAHRRRIEDLQGLALERLGLPFGQVWVGTVGRAVECAAIWMHSTVAIPATVLDAIAAEQRALEGDRHAASQAAEAVVAPLRPEVAHWYLGAVGTRPRSQRLGLAGAVLAPGLDAADSSRTPTFLETSSESNVAFYESLGFEVAGEVALPDGGPHVWAMLRAPR
ncbi:MAG: N-acetyltransferase [Actinobacteria bacterium]|nr:N-acetyltransferase [Actinomycetota bacterium]